MHHRLFIPVRLVLALGAAQMLAGHLPLLAAGTPSAEKKTGQAAPESTPPPAQPSPGQAPYSQADIDGIYELGRSLFEEYATDELKDEYYFPSKEQWDSFLPRLQKALQGESLQDLAVLEQEARSGLSFIQTWAGAEELETWLKERIELIEAAKALSGKPGEAYVQRPQPPVEMPPLGEPVPQPPVKQNIPAYDYWFARLQGSRAPGRAAEFMPALTRSFKVVNTPVELIWLAEVESTFNPSALSPAGARGLFQLMPETAKAYGLSVRLPDERLNPGKSAQAAALLLRNLYSKFGDWALALAAYNAGEGRVRRLLEKTKDAKSFADIAEHLPVETRLYVPRVLATIATRTGVTPDKLPVPKP